MDRKPAEYVEEWKKLAIRDGSKRDFQTTAKAMNVKKSN